MATTDPQLVVQGGQQRTEPGDLESKDAFFPLLSLDDDMLLAVLSFCDPWAVCRFSRTCRKTKQFADANLSHLPRQEADVYVTVADELATYKLEVPSASLSAESRVMDMSVILSQAKYLSVHELVVTCTGVSPQCARSVMTEMLRINSKELNLDWDSSTNLKKRLLFVKCSDPVKAHYLQDISNAPLEALCSDQLSAENIEKIHEILTIIMQSPIYVEVFLDGVSRTVDQCCTLYVNALKKFAKKPGAVGTCSVIFWTPEVCDANTQPDIMKQTFLTCLQDKIEQSDLTANFVASINSQTQSPMILPQDHSYHIRIYQIYPLSWTVFQILAGRPKPLDQQDSSTISAPSFA